MSDQPSSKSDFSSSAEHEPSLVDTPPPDPVVINKLEPSQVEQSYTSNLSALVKLSALVPSLRILIGMCITALTILALYYGRELLIPLALATLFGFLLSPAVLRLRAWGLPKMAAVLTVITLSLGLLVAGAAYLGTQLSNLSQQLPTYQNTIQTKLENLKNYSNSPSVWDGALNTFNMVKQTISKDGNTAQPTQTNKEADQPKDATKKDAQAEKTPKTAEQDIQNVRVVENEKSPVDDALIWLNAIADPVVTAGIVLLFVILILLDRSDLRDRILRIFGGNLNLATDALDEAAERIGTYLRMQLIVNLSYGVPMALGLWMIGVPSAIMWGLIAVVMRFVPYVGPLLSSVFPLALAFAVDPTWNMVLWTLALIATLELISNNIIEPWLYGSSTGLSTLSIILAATFWTSIWGPIGLILSTPLTACLLVMARYIPALKFIEVLIGNEPVLGAPERFYQRLLADDVEEALELANDEIEEDLPSNPEPEAIARNVTEFYDKVSIPAMRLFSSSHNNIATAEHRLRINNGLKQFCQEMYDDYPVDQQLIRTDLRIQCLGARWEVDSKVAALVVHSLQLSGFQTNLSPTPILQDLDSIDKTDWSQVDVVCLSMFSPNPLPQVRLISRRIKRRWPHVQLIVAVWNAQADKLADTMQQRFAVTAVVDSLKELVLRLEKCRSQEHSNQTIAPPIPDNDSERVAALHQSGVLAEGLLSLYQQQIAQTRNAFDTKYAQISWVDEDWVSTPASPLREKGSDAASAGLPREESICTYLIHDDQALIIEDIHRDPRFVDQPELSSNKIRFYAGVPLRDKKGLVLGSLCIMDDEPRQLNEDDLEVLTNMADELMQTLSNEDKLSEALTHLDEDSAQP